MQHADFGTAHEVSSQAKSLLDAAGAEFDQHARMRMIAPTLVASLIAGTEPPYPPAPTPDPATMSRKQRLRAQRVARAREVAEADAARAKARDEEIAPEAQRQAVTAGDAVLRAPRLQRDGVTFVRSTPLVHLQKRSEGKECPTITGEHVKAGKRLADAWDLAGGGIGLGVSSGAGSGDRSILSGPGAAMVQQLAAQREIAAAMTFLGALWPVIKAVALDGSDVTAWAASRRMNPKEAVGYLSAALDRLVEFYRPKPPPTLPMQIRAAVVVPSEG